MFARGMPLQEKSMTVTNTSSAKTRARLDEKACAWVNLLDRLGQRDIWEFARAVELRHRDRRLQGNLPPRVCRSAAKNYARDPARQEPKYQYRRDWLTYWIYYYADGRRRTMEELTGYSGSYIAQCLDTDYYGGRSIGDIAARTIEIRLSLPENAMDIPFFPYTDVPQNVSVDPLTPLEEKWLSLLAGLSDAEVREFTIMVHARRQHNLELMQAMGFTSYPSRPAESAPAVFRNVYQNRRAWLTHCVDVHAKGRRKVMAAMLGVSPSAVSQYLSPSYLNGNGITEKLARRIESRLALPAGTFDMPFDEHRHVIVAFGTQPSNEPSFLRQRVGGKTAP